jgi:hypothetical protein
MAASAAEESARTPDDPEPDRAKRKVRHSRRREDGGFGQELPIASPRARTSAKRIESSRRPATARAAT